MEAPPINEAFDNEHAPIFHGVSPSHPGEVHVSFCRLCPVAVCLWCSTTRVLSNEASMPSLFFFFFKMYIYISIWSCNVSIYVIQDLQHIIFVIYILCNYIYTNTYVTLHMLDSWEASSNKIYRSQLLQRQVRSLSVKSYFGNRRFILSEA